MVTRALTFCSYALLGSLFILVQSAEADSVVDIRTIDGSGNNLANSTWGAAHTVMPRVTDAHYPNDGSGATFYGGPGSNTMPPNPREISNHLYDSGDSYYANRRRLSNMVWQWGQFLDHDITIVHTSSASADFAPIAISPDDPMTPFIPFERSQQAAGTGTSAANPREQTNSITSYIDASNVYGSDATRAAALRDTGNGGRMKTSAGGLLPYNTMGLDNAGGPAPNFFVAGDVRANEQSGLLAMHTLFVREHNRLADLLSIDNPTWNDEQLYQTARKIVGAEMQAITYNEFLPALLGKRRARQLKARRYDYDDTIDASIKNEFAASFYRFGHSMLPDELTLPALPGADADSISLLDSFFNPSVIASDADGSTRHIDQLMLGLSTTVAQEIDAKLGDGVRNFLFGEPGSGGMDLAAINIQRGRDHGLPSYNEMRMAYGLDPVSSFREITRDRKTRKKLRQLYGTVHDIDAWVGGLAEDHLFGSSMGELISTALIGQFTDLRDGDRYFYTGDDELMNNSSVDSVIDIKDVTLSDIIGWNTSLDHVPNNVFRVGRFGFDSVFDGIGDVFGGIGDLFGDFGEVWGNNPTPTSNLLFVPEPTTVLLGTFAFAMLATRRRDRCCAVAHLTSK